MDNILKFFKETNWKIKSPKFTFGTGPEADWKIIFISAITLVVLAITLSIYMYIKIDKGEIFTIDKTKEGEKHVLNIDLLKETVSYYQDKYLKFESIDRVNTSIVDPSR